MRPLIGTSWKMNLTPSEAGAWLEALVPLVAGLADRDLFVLPAYPAIFVARDRLAGTRIAWGAQDVHPADDGAHTGDVSAPMLADLGCTFVEVGHAERRRDHHETPALIAAKVAAVLRWSMIPIVCIGEERPSDPETTLGLLTADLAACLARVPPDRWGRVVVAYEPVWAIGAGARPARRTEIAVVHHGLAAWLAATAPGADPVRIIYGGSVDEDVAPEILAEPGVDGLFVGRRALDPLSFARIAAAAAAVA